LIRGSSHESSRTRGTIFSLFALKHKITHFDSRFKENSMKSPRLIGLALILLVLVPAAARAQEEGFSFSLSNFSLEFLGGLSRINPADLNIAASYEENYLQFYYVRGYDYLHSIYGDNFQVTGSRTGDSTFRPLDKTIPYGVRLRYQASPTFSLTLGVQYLDGTQLSSVSMAFNLQDRRPDYTDYPFLQTVQYQNTGFTIQARAWIPQLGAHFGWDLSKAFRWEIGIAFGPVFANCRSLSQRNVITTTIDGYTSESAADQELKGTTTGLCGELSAGLHVRFSKFIKLLVEGGYSFRELGEVSGSGWYRSTVGDSNGVHDSTLTDWSGTWYIQTSNVSRAWGRFSSRYIQNWMEAQPSYGTNFSRFNLDLSGLQVVVGVGFTL
jgi:hypothetical protein